MADRRSCSPEGICNKYKRSADFSFSPTKLSFHFKTLSLNQIPICPRYTNGNMLTLCYSQNQTITGFLCTANVSLQAKLLISCSAAAHLPTTIMSNLTFLTAQKVNMIFSGTSESYCTLTVVWLSEAGRPHQDLPHTSFHPCFFQVSQ